MITPVKMGAQQTLAAAQLKPKGQAMVVLEQVIGVASSDCKPNI